MTTRYAVSIVAHKHEINMEQSGFRMTSHCELDVAHGMYLISASATDNETEEEVKDAVREHALDRFWRDYGTNIDRDEIPAKNVLVQILRIT